TGAAGATNHSTTTDAIAKRRAPTAPRPAETGQKATTETTTTGAANASTTGATTMTGASAATNVPPLEINVNGKTIPVQLGNPLEIQVGKERVRIVVQQAP